MTTEKPMPFTAPSVLAIQAGTKTQTRRVVKPQPVWRAAPAPGITAHFFDDPGRWFSPPYPVGTRVWVKEEWRVGAWDEDENKIAVDYEADGFARKEWLTVMDSGKPPLNSIGFESMFERLWIQSTDDAMAAGRKPDADGKYHWEPGESPCRWRRAMFMPRWAARIILEITGVRVEPVQNISIEDALAEGILRTPDGGYAYDAEGRGYHEADPRISYMHLWDSINGKKYPWESSPWVWAYTFRRGTP